MKTARNFLAVTATATVALLLAAGIVTGCASLASAPASGGGSGRPSDGTYTFYPRLQASKGGVDVKAYLDRVEIKGGIATFCLVNEAISNGGNPEGEWRNSWRINADQFVLQDLDRPSRTWVRANYGDDKPSGGMFFSFEGVTARRLSLTCKADNPNVVFDEIVLGEPDPVLQLPPLKNGTYTFYPRLRAVKSGAEVNAYIDRIVVRGEYMNIFLTDVPVGKGRNPAGEWGNSWRVSADRFYLQDLDRPARTWVRVNYGDDEVTGGMSFTYQGVNATRLSLTDRETNPKMVFEEIIIGEPDQ